MCLNLFSALLIPVAFNSNYQFRHDCSNSNPAGGSFWEKFMVKRFDVKAHK
jgi:hypothetical protein